jgi:hypothetical protein
MGIASRQNPTVGLATAPARVRDAVGKVLELGDEAVILTNKMIVRVAGITPLLDPGAPAGVMVLTLVSRIQMACPRDGAVEDLYVLRHQADIGDHAIPTPQPPERASDDRVEGPVDAAGQDMHKDGM